ncbi:MAG: glutamine amidotransferase [Actinomycetaceae bacterium]|nr:glutamine amidotransferase [Actinomycetaceae bacterium]
MSESQLRIGILLPSILGTYGDSGNAIILRERARRRGIGAEIIPIEIDDPIPADIDIFTLGGGEDTAQALAARKMTDDRGLHRAVDKGTPVLAICAALQILGQWYQDATGRKVPGLEILDVTTLPQGSRSIGELVTTPMIDGLTEPLTGFENHGGATILGKDAAPLGRVVRGVGNGIPEGGAAPTEAFDGVVQGSVIATYMHGPVLARNPELADLLLSRAVGGELEPLEIPGVERLRRERLAGIKQ